MKVFMARKHNWMRLSGPVMSGCLLLSLVLGGMPVAHAVDYLPSDIPGWQRIVFAGETRYTKQADCIRAEAASSASGLIRETRESLPDDSRLLWSWRADEPLAPGKAAPEQSKAGDDFLARVYVIHEGFFFWQTRAINYVWSREFPVGEHWPNPYTGNAHMVVVQSGADGLGEWRQFERDVRADFKRFHGLEVDRIDAIALMTDADNMEGRASACYRLPRLSTSVSR